MIYYNLYYYMYIYYVDIQILYYVLYKKNYSDLTVINYLFLVSSLKTVFVCIHT